MKLHRDLGVTQKTAWLMQQQLCEAFGELVPDDPMVGHRLMYRDLVAGERGYAT